MAKGQPCAFGDPLCPCQDGDACHYVSVKGDKPMVPPEKRCQKCSHLMELQVSLDTNPKQQWVCLCGWREATYGRSEEGEP